MYHDFWGTHMDALNQFSSKLMTLTTGGGSGTFSAKLALCVAWHEEGGLKKRPAPFNEANKKETSLPLTVTLIVLVMAARTPFCAVQVYDP